MRLSGARLFHSFPKRVATDIAQTLIGRIAIYVGRKAEQGLMIFIKPVKMGLYCESDFLRVFHREEMSYDL